MRFIDNKFLVDNSVISADTTEVDIDDFTSAQPLLAFTDNASITVMVTGSNAACASEVNFIFVAYNRRFDAWDTASYVTITLAASGTSVRYKTIALTPDIDRIKLLSIQNEDTTYTVTVNAAIHIREQ